ncbi:hypothetical protein Taro_000586 [Colocasia esculenta]|uniref:Uncharacterized protein n=1 Tax=Colocasia esculenta TaxID=4460 RepID=A0A843TB74_COLES|nr:hypothetical protein [Colocasia esculenta]
MRKNLAAGLLILLASPRSSGSIPLLRNSSNGVIHVVPMSAYITSAWVMDGLRSSSTKIDDSNSAEDDANLDSPDQRSRCSVDTRPSSQRTLSIGLDSVSTLDQMVSTLDASPRKPVLQFSTKLQAILSRGRTRESRGIPGEKVAVQGKGADPTEEAQEKKYFWHFRCHQSRASPVEKNLHRFPSRLLN